MRNGSWLGRLGSSKRVVTIDLLIVGQGDYGNTMARNALRNLYSDGIEEFELYMDLGYGNPPEVIYCRVTAMDMNLSQGYGRKQEARIEFTATDPRRYRAAQRLATTGSPALAQGFSMPMTYGVRAQAAASPTATTSTVVTNDGTAPADVTYSLAGSSMSVTGPDGVTLSIRFPVAGPITINTFLGLATSNGRDITALAIGASVKSLHLLPGTSTVTGEGGVTLTWQDASV